MAKKNTNSMVGFLCLLAIILSAACLIIGLLGGHNTGLLKLIEELSLLVAVTVSSWSYVKNSSKVVLVLYVVSLATICIFLLLGHFNVL